MRVQFGHFTLDSEKRELDDGSQPIHLSPKAFRLLEVLIANAPRAMRKQELYEQIWPETFVDETNLAGLVNELRTALADQPRKPRFIRTVHAFGYAFCGEIGESSEHTGAIVFRGRQIPLRKGVNTLGRDASATIQIDDPTVSRKHATITIDDNGAMLEDLDSKNGTFIDGVRLIGSVPLPDGQTFVLGDASITFRSSAGSPSTLTVSRRR